MIKMVVSDIDGTLLEEGTSVLKKEYFEIFEKLHKKGIIIVIASGRNYVEASGVFNRLKNKCYLITCNGGAINYQGKQIYKKVMSENKLKQLVKFVRNDEFLRNKPIIFSLANDEQYSDIQYKETLAFLKIKYKSKCEYIDDILLKCKDVAKMNIYDESEKNVKKIKNMVLEKFGNEFSTVVSGKCWIDICDKNATKGNAVKYLQKKFGIKKNEIVCMGDNYNDIPMLRCAKYSFVPTISKDEVKKEARYIMPSYEFDGPLKVLWAIYDNN